MRRSETANNCPKVQVWGRGERYEGKTLNLRAPTEGDRTGNRMMEWGPVALRFQIGGFEFEVPASLAVGIVNQHHAIFIAEAERLLFDYIDILADEARPEDMNDERNNGEPGKDVPRGNEIEAAEIRADGSDRGAAGEPVSPGANLFEALIGQDKINHCGGRLAGDEFQDFVRSAIRRRSMRAHAEAIGNRLELLGFFADAVASAPPPSLMDERAVRGVHQADDGLVHAARQIGEKVRDFETLAEFGKLGRGGRRGLRRAALRIRHVHPEVTVALFTGKCAGVNAIALEPGVGHERGDFAALAGMRVESPAVIGTFDCGAVELAEREWKRAVGANVAQSEGLAARVAAEDERHAEKHRASELAAVNFAAGEGRVPKAPEHFGFAPGWSAD